MDILIDQNGAIQRETNAPSSTNALGDCGRNFKEESPRNKKLRFCKRLVLIGLPGSKRETRQLVPLNDVLKPVNWILNFQIVLPNLAWKLVQAIRANKS